MQDSMMIAEVGGIENVSGSRIATPLAPPSPGNTPISTPSTMPSIISIRLNGLRTIAKPWNSDESSAMEASAEPQGGRALSEGSDNRRLRRRLTSRSDVKARGAGRSQRGELGGFHLSAIGSRHERRGTHVAEAPLAAGVRGQRGIELGLV